MAEGLLSISIETVRVMGIEIPDPQQGQRATPLDGPGRRVSGIEPSQDLPVSNCSVKLWARPPAGLSSMPTEQPTKRPPSTSIGLGAESGDETRGVGPIWSVRHPCRGVSWLASTLGWPVLGGSRYDGGSAATPTQCGLIAAGRMPVRPVFHTLSEQLPSANVLNGPMDSRSQSGIQ